MTKGTNWGALCAVHTLCKNEAILDLFLPLAKLMAVTTVFPATGLPQIPTQSKNSDNEVK